MELTRSERKLIDKAANGDASALPAVCEIFDNHPDLAEGTGNLAFQAEISWIASCMGKNLAGKEAIERCLRSLKGDLGWCKAPPLERLLIERIAICWLQVYDADIRLAQTEKTMAPAEREYHQRRADRVHKRFLAAVKALAILRRLQIPAVQVNVGEKQINIAGGDGEQVLESLSGKRAYEFIRQNTGS